jgi:hypothetical protein
MKRKASKPAPKARAQFKQRGRGNSEVRDGIRYDSKTEMLMFDAFKNVGLKFEFQHRYDFTKTVYKDTKVTLLKNGGAAGIHMVIDFVFERNGITYYVDTKGSIEHSTAVSKLKYNFLKHKLYSDGYAKNSAIVWIPYKHVVNLLKLSKIKNTANFWAYFDSLEFF